VVEHVNSSDKSGKDSLDEDNDDADLVDLFARKLYPYIKLYSSTVKVGITPKMTSTPKK